MLSNYPLLAALLLVGTIIGVAGGMLGIGGGVLVIPALVFLCGFSQEKAVGTSLGMLLPPIGIFAFLAYYRAGNVDVRAAALLAAGFAIGAYLGSRLVNTGAIPADALRTGFAFFMLYVAGMMIFRGSPTVRAATGTVLVIAAYAVGYHAMKMLGRRWEKLPPAAQLYRERRQAPFSPDYEI